MQKNEVKHVTLICIGTGYSKEYRGSYYRYRVYVSTSDKNLQSESPIQDEFSVDELKTLAYWVNRSGVMAMTVWGMSQEFEAKYTLACWLGWDKEFTDHGELCRKMNERIRVIY